MSSWKERSAEVESCQMGRLFPATERCSESIATFGLEHARFGKVRVFIHKGASAFAVKEKFDHV